MIAALSSFLHSSCSARLALSSVFSISSVFTVLLITPKFQYQVESGLLQIVQAESSENLPIHCHALKLEK